LQVCPGGVGATIIRLTMFNSFRRRLRRFLKSPHHDTTTPGLRLGLVLAVRDRENPACISGPATHLVAALIQARLARANPFEVTLHSAKRGRQP
jgi:hypothetical protein